MIVELEKTRLRHGREITGTQFESPTPATGDDLDHALEPPQEHDEPHHPEDLAAVAGFVKSPAFRDDVAAAREFLRSRGQPDDDARAGACAGGWTR
jgi:hypothetical protein